MSRSLGFRGDLLVTFEKMFFVGGAVSLVNTGDRGGDRTRDLLIKSQLLYQLSYTVSH